ncbi:hypothetical protein MDA_GLEAN10008610 [Myotis davidii]|uniref:Uncharacterized protein n=1 Tax=Myotis davidii TaxID=225400 RepID=L5LWX7_MYODS|nr:hypothetical protein MDA_GLEAN10008610 [Myotis davidii]
MSKSAVVLSGLAKLQGPHYGQRHGGSGSDNLGGDQKDSRAIGQRVDDRIEQNDEGHKRRGIPELLLADCTHGEMIPHEEPGSPTEIKCDFPFIRLKSEPARQ